MKRYLDAFAYPLRGENASVMILGVAVLSLIPALYSLLAMGGGWDAPLGLLFLSYYALYLRSILHASMENKPLLPAWPDWERPSESFDDLFSILAPLVVSFLPLIGLRVAVAAYEITATWTLPATIGLFAIGWLCLPMAILVWTFFSGWGILNPVAVAQSAWRTGSGYLFVSVFTAGLTGVALYLLMLPRGMLTTFGALLLAFYALVVSMRMLGMHYNLHRERLGWEDVRTSDLH